MKFSWLNNPRKNARFYWHFSGLLQVYFRCSPTLLPIHFRYTFVISPIGVGDKNRVKGVLTDRSGRTVMRQKEMKRMIGCNPD